MRAYRTLIMMHCAAAATLASFAAPTGLLAQMRMGGAPPPVVPLTAAQLQSHVDSALGPLAERGWFSGSVLVARDGVPLLTASYGLADRRRGIANAPTTRFNVGSMNKMMTAVAVLRLAQDGRLSLSDSVGRWLPDYPVAAVRDDVTVAQLLAHRSGLGSYWNDRFAREKGSIQGVRDYLRLFDHDPLLFPPDTRWEYSNAGFIVLGAIVERVTGRSFEQALQQLLLDPAGMRSTDFSAIGDSAATRAVGYMREGGIDPSARPDTSRPAPPTAPNWATMPNRGGPAGGGYTTVGDLLRFDAALRSGRLLNAAWRDSLWTVRNRDLIEANSPQQRIMPYGFGFSIRETPSGRVVGHTGGAPGISALFDMYLETGYTLAILANVDGPGLFLARAQLDAAIQGLERARVSPRQAH